MQTHCKCCCALKDHWFRYYGCLSFPTQIEDILIGELLCMFTSPAHAHAYYLSSVLYFHTRVVYLVIYRYRHEYNPLPGRAAVLRGRPLCLVLVLKPRCLGHPRPSRHGAALPTAFGGVLVSCGKRPIPLPNPIQAANATATPAVVLARYRTQTTTISHFSQTYVCGNCACP